MHCFLTRAYLLETYLYTPNILKNYVTSDMRTSQALSYVVTKFEGGGGSDENEKVLGKFLPRLRHAKKGVPKFVACGGLFFVVEAQKTVKNR